MDLNNKVALVLGSVKGIGKGVSLALAAEGVKVVATYFDWEEHLPALEADLDGIGAEHLIVKTDLTDTKAIAPLIEKALARFGGLDILINNIERGGWPIVHGAYNREQWDMEQATTLRAKRWVFDATLPSLKASGDGVVINFSSIAGCIGRAGPASLVFNDGYAAANRGVSLLTESWARQGAPEVRVNEIMLGLVETRHGPQTRGWGLLSENQKQALINHTLLGRTGRIEDVVKAAMFLIRDAPFMTGGTMLLDGGFLLGGEPVLPMPKGVV